MRCVIVGESVRVFARAIHCLAKIGHEIYVEPLKKGLSLRTVNSTRSAYGCYIFMTSFFQTYDDGIPEDEGSSNDGLKCKLSVKSCLSVFKSLSNIDRMVDRCSIRMNEPEEELTFLLYCHHGITKTYNLSYQDCESLQAVFTKDFSPNLINVQPRILGEVVANFQNAQEEISLTVCPQNMVVTNYVDEDEDPAKVINTKMVLVAEEFEKFQIGVDAEVTFCLKELKGIIMFADSTDQNIDIHFESGGKPIVFSLTSDPSFEANFVLATLIDLPVTQVSEQTSRQNGSQKVGNPKESTSPSHSQHMLDDDEFDLDAEEDWANDIIAAEERDAQQTSRNNENKHPDFDDSFPFHDGKKASTSSQARKPNDCVLKNKQSQPQSVPSDLACTEMPGSMSADSEKSPGIVVRSGKNKAIQPRGKKHESKVLVDDKQVQDSIPSTPPSKKFKSMFFSAMSGKKSNIAVEKQSNETVILVEDSDVESD